MLEHTGDNCMCENKQHYRTIDSLAYTTGKLFKMSITVNEIKVLGLLQASEESTEWALLS